MYNFICSFTCTQNSITATAHVGLNSVTMVTKRQQVSEDFYKTLKSYFFRRHVAELSFYKSAHMLTLPFCYCEDTQ